MDRFPGLLIAPAPGAQRAVLSLRPLQCVSLKALSKLWETFTSIPLSTPSSVKDAKSFPIGETGRKLANRFRVHLMDIHNENAKPISIHFTSLDHRGEDISVTALKSYFSDQVTLNGSVKTWQLEPRNQHA